MPQSFTSLCSIFQLQVYSRLLEEKLEEMGDAMVNERDHSNEIIRSKVKNNKLINLKILFTISSGRFHPRVCGDFSRDRETPAPKEMPESSTQPVSGPTSIAIVCIMHDWIQREGGGIFASPKVHITLILPLCNSG